MSALPAPVLCLSHLRGSWSASSFAPTLFFLPVLSILAYPYTDGSHQTVYGSGLLLLLSYSTAKGIDPFLCYVKPSVRISTLKGTVTFTYPMTSIVARTCNTSSLPSLNFSGRCRTYFSCAKVVQAVYGKYLYALSRITRRYSVT